MISPVGFAVLMVTVTVVPLSDVEAIALPGPAHIEGNPVAHDVPVGHPGIEPVTVKLSVTGS